MGPKECKAPDRYDPAEVGRLSASAARIRMDTVSGGIAAPSGLDLFAREGPREAVQCLEISEGLSSLTWACNQTLICGAMRGYA